jgi:hypothetical protein
MQLKINVFQPESTEKASYARQAWGPHKISSCATYVVIFYKQSLLDIQEAPDLNKNHMSV